jgi:hypothetical protein
MFSHPATVFGFLIAAGGWFWLLFGVSVDSPMLERPVFNFHSAYIAGGLMAFGYVLIIAGVVARGALRIGEVLALHPQIGAGLANEQVATTIRKKEEAEYRRTGKKPAHANATQSTVDPSEQLNRELREKGLLS